MPANEIIGARARVCLKKIHSRTHFYGGKEFRGEGVSALFFVLDGKAAFEFKDASFVAGKNDLVLWDHGDLLRSTMVPGVPVSFYQIRFDLVSDRLQDTTLRGSGFPHLNRVRNSAGVRSLIKEIYRTFTAKDRYSLQECSALIIRVLRDAEEQKRYLGGKARRRIRGRMDLRIRSTLEYLALNYKKSLDIPALAKIASMHRSHFARLFKETTGMSPYRYVLELKIKKAQDFFLDCDYSPERQYISSELGFHDYSHFYHVFRKVTGLTPSEFVKRHRAR
jgi:AraC-like DNA-binding protein